MGKTASLANIGSIADSSLGFRNRLINSDMRIDQRNAGASVSGTSGVFSVDRWKVQNNSGSARFNVQQNAGSVTPPAGFANYLGVTSTGAYSVAAGDVISMVQVIEGYNTADFAWGTASASTVTMSFWVRSSLTGTFGGALKNGGASYSYPFTYTISSANTWEQKSITITGATASTWASTNAASIEVYFSMGTGSTFNGTAGAWAAADYRSATGATSVVATNGATWYVTGVQLEKGTQATSFDFRSIGQELTLCQRYFQQLMGGSGTSDQYQFIGSVYISTRVFTHIFYKVQMRVAPTITANSLSVSANGNSSSYPSTFFASFAGVAGTGIEFTPTGAPSAGIAVSIDLSAGSLTASSEL
jgi:hypothetical protein